MKIRSSIGGGGGPTMGDSASRPSMSSRNATRYAPPSQRAIDPNTLVNMPSSSTPLPLHPLSPSPITTAPSGMTVGGGGSGGGIGTPKGGNMKTALPTSVRRSNDETMMREPIRSGSGPSQPPFPPLHSGQSVHQHQMQPMGPIAPFHHTQLSLQSGALGHDGSSPNTPTSCGTPLTSPSNSQQKMQGTTKRDNVHTSNLRKNRKAH